MTPPQIKALEALLVDTDFIPVLRSNRPSLSTDEYQEARGWEKCVDFIIQMIDVPEAGQTTNAGYVDVSKL